LRTVKDLLRKGANRTIKTEKGQTATDLIVDLPSNRQKDIKDALAKPCYTGCPLGKIPLMPVEKSKRAQVLFIVLFAVIYLTQLFVIEPKLDVWYFLFSSTLVSAKLLLSFIVGSCSKPGYLEPEKGPEFEFKELVKTVPNEHLCFDCKLIKAPRSKHCQICNKCVDRYEGHCMWLNNCVGRRNSNSYMVFIFYVWLTVFLLGWISMASIRVTACEIEHCPYASMCILCAWMPMHYFATIFDMVVCFFFFVPTSYMCTVQFINYGKGKTSAEVYLDKKNKAANVADDAKEGLLENSALRAPRQFKERRRRSGCLCWSNYGEMCCSKKILTQHELLQMYTQEQDE